VSATDAKAAIKAATRLVEIADRSVGAIPKKRG
jgi:hypothetical protein